MQEATGFHIANNRGKYGEQFLQGIFNYYGHSCVDVSNNPDYMQFDIDFLFKGMKTGEVKTDSVAETTGNMFYETKLTYDNGVSGIPWTDKCKADYLFYLVEHHKTPNIPLLDMNSIYFGKWKKIKTFVETRQSTWRVGRHRDFQNSDRRQYWVAGWLVPLTDMVAHGVMKNIGMDAAIRQKFCRNRHG